MIQTTDSSSSHGRGQATRTRAVPDGGVVVANSHVRGVKLVWAGCNAIAPDRAALIDRQVN
jgi:hypothetical protein